MNWISYSSEAKPFRFYCGKYYIIIFISRTGYVGVSVKNKLYEYKMCILNADELSALTYVQRKLNYNKRCDEIYIIYLWLFIY